MAHLVVKERKIKKYSTIPSSKASASAIRKSLEITSEHTATASAALRAAKGDVTMKPSLRAKKAMASKLGKTPKPFPTRKRSTDRTSKDPSSTR